MNPGDTVKLKVRKQGFKPGALGTVATADTATAIVDIFKNFRGTPVNPPRRLIRSSISCFEVVN